MPDRFPLRRIFAPLFIAFVVLFALFAIVTWMPLRTARAEWRSGRVADAISNAESWSGTRMWPNQYHQLLAIAYTSSGQQPAARAHLAQLQGKQLWISLVPKDEVAKSFFGRGHYQSFIEYDKAVRERGEPADIPLHRAAAFAALGRYDEAARALQTMNRSAVDARKLATLETTIAQRRSGRFAFVFDRNGSPIADTSAGGLLAVDRDFVPLIEEKGGELTFGSHKGELGGMNTVETTLDSAVQHAAKAALQNYRGAFVAIDPRTNEILAIVSNDSRNLALEEQYEPGSIIKVLTGLGAFNSGTNVPAMFPYHCSGDLLIDGRHFGDWIPAGHGTLPDLDEALAESCNVFFADVGIRLGAERLQKFMTTAGFDGQTDLGVFKVPLGRFAGGVFNKYETGHLAIGLEHETVNAIHVAMLASMMANRGLLTTPRLMRARRSVLGEVVTGPPPQAQARIASHEIAEWMVQAMAAVVTRPKGTGRRADIDGVSLALKTGTAGRREDGYHAVIMAFAPVDSPKIAFGLIAERSGPAEFAGAKIAHDFLLQIRDRLK
ncbi:MAG: penicillin-binding transpeptidase domain-containing protein [Thermoanaerobaculia bacterium]